MKQSILKNLIGLFVVLILLSGVMGCTSSYTSQENEKEPITIGWIGPLSGEAAVLGIPNQKGVALAVEEINAAGGINGRFIEVIYEDDRYERVDSFDAYHKLTAVDDVDAVFLMTYGSVLALAQTTEEQEMVMINPLDTSEAIADAGTYTFGIGVYDEGIGETLADFAVQETRKRVGVLYYQDDPFMPLVKDGFVEHFKKLGEGEVDTYPYAGDERDFRSYLIKMKEKNIDTLIVLGYDEAGLALRQAEELSIEATFMSIDTATSEGFIRNAGTAIDGLYITFWEGSESEKFGTFVSAYETKYNEEPELLLFTATGYDAMTYLAETMKKGAVKGKDLRDNMHTLKHFEGVSGTLDMSDDGIVRSIREEMFVMNEKGEFEALS